MSSRTVILQVFDAVKYPKLAEAYESGILNAAALGMQCVAWLMFYQLLFHVMHDATSPISS